MAEVEAGEQGHMADDQPQRGVGDIQAGEPEINHVAEFTAIVLTCKKGEKMKEDYLFGIWRHLPAQHLVYHPRQQLTGFVCRWRE